MTSELLVMAFDPAITSATWAALHVAGRAISFAAGGEVPIDLQADELRGLLARLGPDVVAVECPAKAIFASARAPSVMRSTRASGWLEGACVMAGASAVLTVSANTWRTLLVGKGNADDERIACAVNARVVGLPKRTNNHLRDAVGLAAVVGTALSAGTSVDRIRQQIETMELTKGERVRRLARRSRAA
jgi:Holliday junction resolvasome RuvABC endonuclease subunit